MHLEAGPDRHTEDRARGVDDSRKSERIGPLRSHRQHHGRDEDVQTSGLGGQQEDCGHVCLVFDDWQP